MKKKLKLTKKTITFLNPEKAKTVQGGGPTTGGETSLAQELGCPSECPTSCEVVYTFDLNTPECNIVINTEGQETCYFTCQPSQVVTECQSQGIPAC